MKTSLVLTVLGSDRPGLVESISDVLVRHGANWEESRMANLAGKFAGILLASVDSGEEAALIQALKRLRQTGLAVDVERSGESAPVAAHHDLRLELVGQDHPGIVRDISHVLASRDISVDELTTEVRSATMSGENLFHASARLRIPANLDTDELRDLLEDLANELMVDITLDEDGGG